MAVVVVSFHSGLGYLWNLTYSGVTFFFISSAFLLSAHHPFDRLTARDYRTFVVGHAMRLYPLNWLALALMIALALAFHTTEINWYGTALTALLVQSWSPVHEVHYGLNSVAWFMSALLGPLGGTLATALQGVAHGSPGAGDGSGASANGSSWT